MTKTLSAEMVERIAERLWQAEPERIGSRRLTAWADESEDTKNRYRPPAIAAIDESLK